MSKSLVYVEIDIPFCANIYGEAPCTAALGVTGEIKCFNSLATCQDRPNYIDDPVTLRFSEDSVHYPKEIEAIPSLVGHSMTPATVSLGRDLGQRASLSVTFKDHRWPDTASGFDKYVSERPYDPVKQGTFWGKFRSRQPFLRGRALRLIRGFVGQAIGEMETRHYVIDSFDFGAATGRYTITAKDVLKLLDGDRAQAPRLSQGFLVAGIDDDDTEATLSPAGIGDLEYPASGYVAIGGKEICSFTRSGDVLTLTRAQLGTIAIEHDAQDRVQLGLRYVAQDAAVIVEDLCTEYANVDPSFITLANWQAETAAFLDRVFSADLFEPTPVNQLVSELIEDAALSIWYDEVTQQIRLRVIRPISTDADTFDRNNILSETTHTREQPNERISQVWRYFAKRNPLEGQNDPDNYRSVAVTIDADAEADYGSSAIHKIYSRWIPFGGRSIATKANALFLSRYRDPPRRFNFHSFRGGVVMPTLGQGYRFKAIGIQDATGAEDDAPIQITRLKPGDAANEVEAEEMLATAVEDEEGDGERVIIIDGNAFNLNGRTLHDALFPAPIGETGEGEGDGEVIVFIVENGVTVGSTDTANPAFTVGDWPAGVDITVTVNGRVQGKGGDGGDGASGEGGALTGLPGGVALHTDYPINLEDDGGEIWGGGGGGGGGASGSPGAFPFSDVNGGGGGAGTNPGDGGDAPISFGINPGDPGTSEAGGAGNTTGTIDAGDGGDPGQAGETTTLGAGGAAGAAIDGISNVTTIGEAGDRRGPEIN